MVCDHFFISVDHWEHSRDLNIMNKDSRPSCVNAVVTTQQERNVCTKTKSLPVPELTGSDVRPENILKAHLEDETLKKIQSLVGKTTDDCRVAYVQKKGLLYRKFQLEKVENGKKFTQLVVPKTYQMKSSH